MLHNLWKRVVSLILVLAMTVSFFPANVLAEDDDADLTCSPQTGMSSIYEYTTFDIGKAGIAYVNECSASLHLRRSDLSLGGERLPVDIEFYYDPVNLTSLDDAEVNPYGIGWMTTYNQVVQYISETESFAYKNENGTWVYFENSGSKENGQEIWREETTLGIGSIDATLYRTTDTSITDTTSVDIVYNEIHHEFDANGRLTRLWDGNNQILIEYVSGSLYKIQKITDSVGRQFCFSYSSIGSNGVLTQITCKSANNTTITSNNTAIQASYTIAGGLLTAVTSGSGDSVAYTYNSENRLESAANVDACGYSFSYADNSERVAVVCAKAGMGTVDEESGIPTTIVVSESGTVITADNVRQVLTFDSCGRLLSCELQSITMTTDTKGDPVTNYNCYHGYILTYSTITKDDGTTVNEVTNIQLYNADGAINDISPSEDTESNTSINTQVTDSYGNILTDTTTVGKQHQTTSYTYSSDGNFITSATDENGNTTQYSYDINNGNLMSLIDGNGNEIEYSYNAARELANAHLDVSSLTNGTCMDASYIYSDGRLTQLNYGSYTYTFTYDIWGNTLSVKMNNKLLVSYNYGANASKGMVDTLTYGNGKTVYYGYNTLGQIVSVAYGSRSSIRFQYTYDISGNLSSISDTVTGRITTYADDGYSICAQDGTVRYSYTADDENSSTEVISGNTYYTTIEQSSTSTQETTTKQIKNSANLTIATADSKLDGFGKLTEKNFTFGDTTVYQKYDYKEDSSGTTGTLAEAYHTGYPLNSTDTRFFDYTYEYDGNGNIISVTATEKYTKMRQVIPDPITPPKEEYSLGNGSSAGTNSNITLVPITTTVSNSQVTYSYDEAGQLIEAVDGNAGRTYRYTYDNSGNIQTAQAYSVSASGTETLVDSKTYSYSNGILTGYTTNDGTQVVYQNDTMGNPVRITKSGSSGYQTLTWGEGRMLTGLSDYDTDITYTYDADGLRIGKSIAGETSKDVQYIWGANGLAAVITGDQIVEVIYDANGEASGFSVDGTKYTYVKNLQGDVIRILDTSKAAVVNYSYDPWGVPTISGDTDLAAMNPCSYRGYYYDWESGYYYLQSRYYDPAVGRFLNADDTALLYFNGNTLEGNLFAYCKNDPVNFNDTTGHLGKHWWNKVSFIGNIIDAVLYLIGVHATNKALESLRNTIRRNRDKIVDRVWKRICGYFASLTKSYVRQAVDVALILIGTTIGDLIAKALDYIDPWWGFTRSNGYIFN